MAATEGRKVDRKEGRKEEERRRTRVRVKAIRPGFWRVTEGRKGKRGWRKNER